MDFDPHGRLMADVARLIEELALQRFREVLLRYPMVAEGVGVGVTLAVAQALRVAVRVLQVVWHLDFALVLDGRQGIEEAEGTVALRCGCEVEGGLREVETALRQAHVIESLRGCR